jgi:hypothetical protein
MFGNDPIALIREGLALIAVGDRRVWSGAARSVEVLAPMVRGREEEFAASEEVLLDAARDLRADDLAEVARRWRGIVDDHQDSARILDRRGPGIAKTSSGMGVIEGELDQEGTETVLDALDRAAPPDPVDGPEPPRSCVSGRPTASSTSAGRSSTARAAVDVRAPARRWSSTTTPPRDAAPRARGA